MKLKEVSTLKNKDYGKLDEKTLIFRQIDRISRLISQELEDTSPRNWSILTERFGLAVKNLEAILSPLIDEQFEKRKKELVKKFKENSEESEEKGRDPVFDKKAYHNEVFSELIKLLYRNSVYFGESDEFVIDKTKDKDKEAVTID